MPDDFMANLIEDLEGRLKDLETEKAAITRAVRALEGRKPRADRVNLQARLIERIRTSPGSRTSFLALEFGVTASTVATHLRKLEQSGAVVKRGLGWELSTREGQHEASRSRRSRQSRR
jgi:DNA-binding transcriptional ArsR family regulator